MLMTQAIIQLDALNNTFQSSSSLQNLINNDLAILLLKIASLVVDGQKPNGSWGERAPKEETAYAVLILTYVMSYHGTNPLLRQKAETAISGGRLILLERTAESASGWLWIEKVTYKSEVLSKAYVLAALKRAADLATDNTSNKNVNGYTNGAANGTNGVNGHSLLSNHAHGNVNEHEHDLETNGDGIQDEERVEHVSIYDSPIIVHTSNTEDGYYQRNEWTTDQEQILLGPFDYLESLPGKNMRSQLIQAFNTWLKVPEKSLAVIEKVISMLHTASLLIDDIQDQSLLRRGQPVANSIFGTAQTMNSGNYIYFTALREIQQLHNPQAINIYVNSLIDLHRGQGMELFWRDSLMCPTEEEYLDMVANKTGGLFCLAIQLMQAEATVEVDFVPLVRLLGIIFQICDDYLNLQSTAYTDNKGLCEDLTEGKFSFPIIHSIRANSGNRQLINILKQKPREDDLKRYALSYMEGTDSFNYTRGVVNKLKEEALDRIHGLEKQGLDENIGIRKLLARISLEL
jgi:geranylgeranyl pyrophosphate synthase